LPFKWLAEQRHNHLAFKHANNQFEAVMGRINIKGLIWGVLTWIISIFVFYVNGTLCFSVESCRIDGLFVSGGVALGLLIPAWIVSAVASALSPSKPKQVKQPEQSA
jgi:hypothetical protein